MKTRHFIVLLLVGITTHLAVGFLGKSKGYAEGYAAGVRDQSYLIAPR